MIRWDQLHGAVTHFPIALLLLAKKYTDADVEKIVAYLKTLK
jgi:hypothetical protein